MGLRSFVKIVSLVFCKGERIKKNPCQAPSRLNRHGTKQRVFFVQVLFIAILKRQNQYQKELPPVSWLPDPLELSGLPVGISVVGITGAGAGLAFLAAFFFGAAFFLGAAFLGAAFFFGAAFFLGAAFLFAAFFLGAAFFLAAFFFGAAFFFAAFFLAGDFFAAFLADFLGADFFLGEAFFLAAFFFDFAIIWRQF